MVSWRKPIIIFQIIKPIYCRFLFLTAASLLLLVLFFQSSPALAATYYFRVLRADVNLFIQPEGTAAIEYTLEFQNDTGSNPIDFIDIGLPNKYFVLSAISAEIDGKSIKKITNSEYVKPGITLDLETNAILSGKSGLIHVLIGKVNNILYHADGVQKTESYASLQFTPNWFGKEFCYGTTAYTFTIILPPGLNPEEPVYYTPHSWPGSSQPESNIDDKGRIYYRWRSQTANSYTQYFFGGAFPARLVPAAAIISPPLIDFEKIDFEELAFEVCCWGTAGLIILGVLYLIYSVFWLEPKRKLQYFPPKIAVEGNGIKRGLTAVEAAIILEKPLDQILTMILFSVIKKGAANVTRRDPLEIKVSSILPEDLNTYERDFLTAFPNNSTTRKKAFKEMIVKLVQSVSKQISGFSRKETIAYYQNIVAEAWKQIESAGTPEIRSQLFEQNLDWAILDRKFVERTANTFFSEQAYIPSWWSGFDPDYKPATISKPALPAGSSNTTFSLPQMPGSNFASAIVSGMEKFSAKAIGDVTAFTNSVTTVSNPIPKSTSSGSSVSKSRGGGGFSCACACACAGCACACAGGGR